MIIQKRICDKCKKEIEERDELYFKANISVVNATENVADNSVNGDYCKDCFKDICESLQNIEPEEETKEEEEETKEEAATSDEPSVAAL